MVIDWLKQLDELLRGERVRGDLLAQGKIDLRLRVFVPVGVLLGAIYGFFMGWYALSGFKEGAWPQLAASTLKLPALFLLTLAVTFPSLYVFNALVGCRMTFASTLRVLVGAIVVNLALAASLGPILAFFTLSTTSYAFMVLLNVALLGLSGMVSLGFLLRALRALARSRAYEEAAREAAGWELVEEAPGIGAGVEPPPVQRAGAPPTAPGPLNDPSFVRYGRGEEDVGARSAARAQAVVASAQERRVRELVGRRERTANSILSVWTVIYCLVGAQMGWILRPFIGAPGMTFTWLRPREGSFFQAVWLSLKHLVGA